MNPQVPALLHLAREDLKAAQLLLDADLIRASLSRSYYAVFQAARAALLHVGESPISHNGIANRFYVRFVATDHLDEGTSRVLPFSAQQRQGADYDALTHFDSQGAADLLADAKVFVEKVALLIAPEG